jgi:hypothetical protein
MEITPQAVKEAYDRHPHIKPTQGKFYTIKENGQHCACALSVLTIDCIGEDNYTKTEVSSRIDHICNTLKLREGQVWDFIRGFDSNDTRDYALEEDKELFSNWDMVSLGIETRKLIFGE